jgi:hypothetical protein
LNGVLHTWFSQGRDEVDCGGCPGHLAMSESNWNVEHMRILMQNDQNLAATLTVKEICNSRDLMIDFD